MCSSIVKMLNILFEYVKTQTTHNFECSDTLRLLVLIIPLLQTKHVVRKGGGLEFLAFKMVSAATKQMKVLSGCVPNSEHNSHFYRWVLS